MPGVTVNPSVIEEVYLHQMFRMFATSYGQPNLLHRTVVSGIHIVIVGHMIGLDYIYIIYVCGRVKKI